MRVRTALKGISGVILAAGLISPGHAATVQCPPELLIFQRVVDPPAGTRAFDRAPKHPWDNAEFSDGPPEEQAWLAPDGTRRDGKTVINHWQLAKSTNGVWLSCDYQGTSLSVALPLPKPVTACDVTYDNTVSPPRATSLTCR
jgi:hypothetical protein